MNAAQRAREQLRTWPHLTAAPASCGTGDALLSRGAEIVHFHSERDADLHLTAPAIDRMHGELRSSTALRLHPGSQWVTVHLDCDSDADLLVTLVSVALRVHGEVTVPVLRSMPCNLARVEIARSESPAPSGARSGRWADHAPRFARGARRLRPH